MSQAMASELWTKYDGDTRHYLVLDNDDGIKVKLYSQEMGDYQDLISVQTFKNNIEARTFIDNNYPKYTATKVLKEWPVNTSVSEKKNSNLWIAQNQWSDDWEQKYADWLKDTITSDFYMKYNIPTDCADAQIGFRWIFARINSLPVANTVSDTGSLFGQFSMRKQWENLPTSYNWYDDQLFLAALNYVMDMTSTRTVMATDGFHVAITQQGLRAGTFIVSQTNGSGHIRTITDNYYTESGELPLYTQSATSPRELRPLYKEAFVDQAWPLRGTREIMAMRWPIVSRGSWVLTEKNKDPRFSEEQFDVQLKGNYYSFIQFVLSRVKPSYNPNSLISTGIDDLVNYTIMRIKIVRDGYEFCRNHDCRPGTQAYEDWSTPNRDAKFLIKFNEVEDLVKSFDPANPGLYDSWINSLNTTTIDVEGNNLSLAQIRNLLEKKKMSFNPSDPILKRWGLN
ncbi:MAG: hypothetical protein H7177_02925 [Rhizobacter sp.]|nr:hypothetical protein [Bacteriovorax sp.]